MDVRVNTPALRRNLAKLVAMVKNKSGFVKLWANAAAQEGRETARAKGGRRWWRDLARSVQVRSAGESVAEVSSRHVGANLKQYGGVVRPVRAKALTIPIAPEAEDKRAYELDRPERPLFRLPKSRLLGYAKGKGKRRSFKALYVLAKSAVQPPDPWFPGENRVIQLGEREAVSILRKERREWST